MSELAEKQRTNRQKHAGPGGYRDRLVRFLRVALPAAAGCLIAVLAFSPFTENRELSFLLAKDGVDLSPERMRVTEALYRGEDDVGRPFSLRAGSAVQKSSKDPVLEMKDLRGSLFIDDARASIIAGQGLYNLDEENMRVNGPLSVDNGRGYSLTATNVEFSLKNKKMQSFGPVNGSTKVGTFSANKLEADLTQRTITLTGNAKLRINQGGQR